MGFNQGNDRNQATRSGASDSAADSGRDGFFSRLTSPATASRLLDFAPQRMTVVQIIVGMILGMLTAYLLLPIEFTGASPRHMSPNAIEQWVRMVAVGHSEDIHYDGENALTVLEQIPSPQQVVRRLQASASIPIGEREALANLESIPTFAELTGAEAPADPGLLSSTLQVLLPLIIAALAIPVVVIAARTLLSLSGRTAPPESANATPRPRSQASRGQPAPPATEKRWYDDDDETEQSSLVHEQFGMPIFHKISTYQRGERYEDAANIELGQDQDFRFLGECGISTVSQAGNELQSVQVWVFDQTMQETQAKIFVAPGAINSASLLEKISKMPEIKNPQTDIVIAEPGAKVLLQTNTLCVQGEIKAVMHNFGGGAPSSGIENLRIELLAWHRHSYGFGDEFPPPADAYGNMEYAPPAQRPATSATPPPPAGSPYRPAAPPDDDDIDPFGGTGDFDPKGANF